MDSIPFFDLEIGTQVAELTKETTNVQLFRFSAVTWNAHRIHYDKDYAQSEGYPDILVQAHLHGSFMTQAVVDWLGGRGILTEMEWKNRSYAVVGEKLTTTAAVKEKYEDDGKQYIVLDLTERSESGATCATGQAVVQWLG